MGHRPRGLQRRRRRLGLPAPRPARAARRTAGARTASPGICDRYQLLCFAPAFWNGRDPHPQGAAVRRQPVRGQPRRGRQGVLLPRRQHADPLVHVPALQVSAGGVPLSRADRGEPAPRRAGSGVRAARHRRLRRRSLLRHRHRVRQGRPGGHLAIRIKAHNRGPDAAPLHILPHLWFRNTWALGADRRGPSRRSRASARTASSPGDRRQRHVRRSQHAGALPARPALPVRDRRRRPLFTDNETNGERVYGPGNTSRKPYVKDAFHRAICERRADCVNPTRCGTKAALHYQLRCVPAGGSVTLRLRFTDRPTPRRRSPTVDTIIAARKAEADEFYAAIQPRARPPPTSGSSSAGRWPGCCGRKQSYLFDVARWLDGDEPDAAAAGVAAARSATSTGGT